jgi:hypothetical protein
MAEEATTDTPKPRRNGTKKKSLMTKMTEVLASISGVVKTGYNDFQKYSYAEEAAIMSACRDELAKRHIMIIPSIENVIHEGTLTTIETSYTFVDGETGEQFVTKWAGTGSDKGDKGLYKAITGSQKYLLLKTFLIPTGENGVADDPEHPAREVQPAKAVVKTAPPASPTPQTGSVISEKQAKRLYAIAKSKDVDVDHFQAYLKENYGYDRFADIERGKYDDIVNLAESGTSFKPAEAPAPELAADDIPF